MITLFIFTNFLVIDLAAYETMEECKKSEIMLVARFPENKFRTDCIKLSDPYSEVENKHKIKVKG